MAETAREAYITPVLTSVTRRHRTGLLTAVAAAVLVSKAGLNPQAIPSLGIRLDGAEKDVIPLVLAVTWLYFAVGFLIHGACDYVAWREGIYVAVRDEILGIAEVVVARRAGDEVAQAVLQEARQAVPSEYKPRFKLLRPVAMSRVVFDLLVPGAIGLSGVYFLWPLVCRALSE